MSNLPKYTITIDEEYSDGDDLSYLVYRHIRVFDGEVFYIGISKDMKRPYDKLKRSDFWKRYTNKYEYIVEIVKENLTKKEAINMEISLIKQYGRRDKKTGTLVNLTDGGEGLLNTIPWNKGIKYSDELKEYLKTTKRSSGMLGKKMPKETVEKLRIMRIGKKIHSEEHKNNLKLISNGFDNPNASIVLNLENGVFYTLKEASEIFNINYTQLSGMLSGKRKNNTNLIKI